MDSYVDRVASASSRLLSGVAGQIIDAILSAGFDISAMEQRHLDPQDAAEFLEVYKTVVPEFSVRLPPLRLVDYTLWNFHGT